MTRRLAVRFAVLGLIMGVVGGLGPSAAAQEPPPPQLEVEIEVDSVGIIHPVSLTRNEVALTGTAVCSRLASLDVFAEVRQLADGRFLINGHGGEFFRECDGEISWTFRVQSENGLFAGGLADVEIGAHAFDSESGDHVFVEVLQEIRLLGPEGTFTDDDGNIHEGAIEAIAAEGITKGCNPPVNDRYCPSGTVTRGQMAAFLVRALGLTDNGGGDLFVDDDGSIFENDIDKLGTAEVTKGCNPPVNDRYCPDGKVTRGQMAAFLVRAFGYTDDGGGNLFTDDDGSVFESDIDRLATAGVTKGCNPPTNDRYCPDSLVTRGQMATLLTRALGLTPISLPPST